MSSTDASQFRGYVEINRALKERVVENNGFELGKYLGEAAAIPNPTGILSLLGTYNGSGTTAEFRNGDPNSLNMILWYVALTGLSNDLASFLVTTPALPVLAGKLQLKENFVVTAKPLTTWPAPEAMADEVLLNYWQSLLSYDAPEEDFLAWKNFVLSSPTLKKGSAKSAVAAMTLAALFNPYFLLRS